MPASRYVPLLLALALGACADNGDDQRPYLEFSGGGFIFNYRTAVVDYGFVATVKRRIEPGTILEAQFENPAGGEPFVESVTATAGRLQYAFRSPPVQGVKADRDYRVVLRVLDRETRQPLAAYARHYRSDLDQEVMPANPLTVGPGYHKPGGMR